MRRALYTAQDKCFFQYIPDRTGYFSLVLTRGKQTNPQTKSQQEQLTGWQAYFGSQIEGLQFIVVGKAWWKEHEVAGHTVSTFRKQMDGC